MSDEMLSSPCVAIEAGKTVGSLGKGYVSNTKCIHKFEEKMLAIREWQKEKALLYSDKKDKQ